MIMGLFNLNDKEFWYNKIANNTISSLFLNTQVNKDEVTLHKIASEDAKENQCYR